MMSGCEFRVQGLGVRGAAVSGRGFSVQGRVSGFEFRVGLGV